MSDVPFIYRLQRRWRSEFDLSDNTHPLRCERHYSSCHGVLFNVHGSDGTVKTLELHWFGTGKPKPSTESLEPQFWFVSILPINRSLGADFDNRNNTTYGSVTKKAARGRYKISWIKSYSSDTTKTSDKKLLHCTEQMNLWTVHLPPTLRLLQQQLQLLQTLTETATVSTLLAVMLSGNISCWRLASSHSHSEFQQTKNCTRTHRVADRQTDMTVTWIDGRMDKKTNGRTNGRMDRHDFNMDTQTDRQIN